jgi:DNA-binding LacI/PurR family transcriptional regulator
LSLTPSDGLPTRRRPKFGVVGTEFEGEYTLTILKGLHSTAASLDIDLVVYSVMRSDAPGKFPEQFKINFEFMDASVLDGIVFLGGNLVSYTEALGTLESLKQRFEHIPSVVLGNTIGSWPSVTCDGYIGFKNLMQHLIQDHGHTSIAILVGPDSSEDSNERYRAYLDAHREAGLVPNPKLHRNGQFLYLPGREAFADLMQTGIPFTAIVCASDNMAWGCIAGALDLGLNLPQDMVITGFDDIYSYNSSRPSLTSVNQNLDKQAEAALSILHAQYHGLPADLKVQLPARLMVRSSCGCINENAAQHLGSAENSIAPNESLLRNLEIPTELVSHIESALQALLSTIAEPEPDHRANEIFARLTTFWHSKQLPIAGLRSVLFAMQLRLRAQLNPEKYTPASHRIQIFLMQIEMAVDIVGNVEQSLIDKTKNLHFAFKTRVASDDLEELGSGFEKGLQNITVQTCFVALYERSLSLETILKEGLPSSSRLFFALADGKVHPVWCTEAFSTCDLLPSPAQKALQDTPRTLMAFPLFHLDQHFGFVVLEWRPNERFSYEELRHEISNSLHHSLLVRELDAAKNLLRQDLERATMANENLSQIAMRDAMTGLFNRRGFLQLAESVMHTARISGPRSQHYFCGHGWAQGHQRCLWTRRRRCGHLPGSPCVAAGFSRRRYCFSAWG